MGSSRQIDIREVVNLLGLKIDPKDSINADTFNVQCPFCRDRKYHMNINCSKNAYACVLCSKEKGQGVLDLYSRAVHGVRCITGPGGNSKQIYKELCDRLHYDVQPVQLKRDGSPRPSESQSRVLRADDAVVDRTYKHLLEFRPFRLSELHRKNLCSRGFSHESIERNQYRTVPSDFSWLTQYKSARQICEELQAIIKKSKPLKKRSLDELAAGLAVCAYLQGVGCTLEGVPGFFKIGDFWCFNVIPGMLVPTRDIEGRVVALQVRRDKPAGWNPKNAFLRYMTVSSKGLPRGATEGISRAHFPLENPPLKPGVQVCVTEGPLKADAAVELMSSIGYGEPTYFIALHGTMNTKELPGFFKRCKSVGITRIWNAFDMDKTTNVHVADAGKSVWKKANAVGLGVVNKCWDEDYAKVKVRELSLLCAENDVMIPTTLNPFIDIANMARALEAIDVPHSYRLLPDGTEEKNYWDPETKGIDDFLLKQAKERWERKGSDT